MKGGKREKDEEKESLAVGARINGEELSLDERQRATTIYCFFERLIKYPRAV